MMGAERVASQRTNSWGLGARGADPAAKKALVGLLPPTLIRQVFSPKELVDLIARESTLPAAADKIISEARARWQDLWQGENTSLVVFALPT